MKVFKALVIAFLVLVCCAIYIADYIRGNHEVVVSGEASAAPAAAFKAVSLSALRFRSGFAYVQVEGATFYIADASAAQRLANDRVIGSGVDECSANLKEAGYQARWARAFEAAANSSALKRQSDTLEKSIVQMRDPRYPTAICFINLMAWIQNASMVNDVKTAATDDASTIESEVAQMNHSAIVRGGSETAASLVSALSACEREFTWDCRDMPGVIKAGYGEDPNDNILFATGINRQRTPGKPPLTHDQCLTTVILDNRPGYPAETKCLWQNGACSCGAY